MNSPADHITTAQLQTVYPDQTSTSVSKLRNTPKLGNGLRFQPLKSKEDWGIDSMLHPERYMQLYILTEGIESAKDIASNVSLNHRTARGLAFGNLVLGDTDKLFEALTVAINEHDRYIFDSLTLDPRWHPVKSDPRFIQAMKLLEPKKKHSNIHQLNEGANPTGSQLRVN